MARNELVKPILTRIDSQLNDRILSIIKKSPDLDLNRSEIVRVILIAFFKSQQDQDFAKVRELIIMERKRLLKSK